MTFSCFLMVCLVLKFYILHIEKYVIMADLKLNKKAQFKKSMVISCAEDIGKAGGSLQNIKDAMTERQQQIIQELFPYGTETVHLERQAKRPLQVQSKAIRQKSPSRIGSIWPWHRRS